MSHHPIASKAFSSATLRRLAKINLYVVSSTFVPGADGSYASGQSAYALSDGRLVPFLTVLAIAEGKQA